MTDSILNKNFAYSTTTTVPFPFVQPYLLDLIGGTVLRAYSTRKLRAAYAGNALRVRRSSDNAEQNIGFDGNGELDTSALAAFVSSNNGFITTFYDQSAAADNMVQATAGSQPRIVNAGVVDVRNAKAAAYLNSSLMNSTSSFSPDEGLVVCAYELSAFNSFDAIIGGDTGDNPNAGILGNSGTGSIFNSTGLILDRCFVNNVSTTTFPMSGAANHINGNGNTLTWNTCQIGRDRANASRNWIGWFCEVILFSGSLSSGDRSIAYLNQKAYWGTA
jgi:hypothetical protein